MLPTKFSWAVSSDSIFSTNACMDGGIRLRSSWLSTGFMLFSIHLFRKDSFRLYVLPVPVSVLFFVIFSLTGSILIQSDDSLHLPFGCCPRFRWHRPSLIHSLHLHLNVFDCLVEKFARDPKALQRIRIGNQGSVASFHHESTRLLLLLVTIVSHRGDDPRRKEVQLSGAEGGGGCGRSGDTGR